MRTKKILFRSLAIALILCCAIVSTIADTHTSSRHTPQFTADFTISPDHPVIGQTITVKGSAYGGISPYTYAWDTSDGQTAVGQTVTFTAPVTAGPFTINLTVTDNTPPTPQNITVSRTITVKTPHH
jgi:hypothetical protein